MSGIIYRPGNTITAADASDAAAELTSIDGKITAVDTAHVTISSALPAGTNAIGKTTPSLSSSIVSAPAALTGTGSAQQMASATAVQGVLVQADTTNTTNLRIGDSNATTSRGIQLAPGDSLFFLVSNSNVLYYVAESGSPKLNVFVY